MDLKICSTCCCQTGRGNFAVFVVWLYLLCLSGCVTRPENSLVLYSAADREYAQPIIDAFQRRHPEIKIFHQFDVEATKTVGLARRLVSESANPQCDVFWNNELMHTLNLESKGLLKKVVWDIPAGWPGEAKSDEGNWVGFAARARVLIINRNMLPESGERPNSIYDLADPRWAKRCGIALPLFGTTATHFTLLSHHLGADKAEEFFRKVKDNAVVLSGNKQVALQVASGRLAWGLTDTDDALTELDAGMPIEIIFPDQLPHQMGALRIPNSVSVMKGCPNPVAAELFANYLVAEKTEGRLAMGVGGQFPLRPEHPEVSRAQLDRQGRRVIIRWMDADFKAAAELWPETSKLFEQIFKY